MESKIILPCYSKYLIFIYIVGMVLNIALAKSLMLIIPTIFEILVVLLFVLREFKESGIFAFGIYGFMF